MTTLEHDLVIPAEFVVGDDGPRRRAFEDAVAWCAAQTDPTLWWLRTRIARRLPRGSFFEAHLFRTDPRENLIFLMIVAANLRAVQEHAERETRANRLLEAFRPRPLFDDRGTPC